MIFFPCYLCPSPVRQSSYDLLPLLSVSTSRPVLTTECQPGRSGRDDGWYPGLYYTVCGKCLGLCQPGGSGRDDGWYPGLYYRVCRKCLGLCQPGRSGRDDGWYPGLYSTVCRKCLGLCQPGGSGRDDGWYPGLYYTVCRKCLGLCQPSGSLVSSCKCHQQRCKKVMSLQVFLSLFPLLSYTM